MLKGLCTENVEKEHEFDQEFYVHETRNGMPHFRCENKGSQDGIVDVTLLYA